jgi:hypothetical protein
LGARMHPLLSSLLLHICCMGQHPEEALCHEQPQTAVVLDSLGNLQRVRHTITQETVLLPQGEHPWAMSYCDAGAYVHRPGDRFWVSHFLKKRLHSDNGRLFVTDGQSQQVWLTDWLQKRQATFFKLKTLAVEGKPVILKAFKMHTTVEESAYLWELRYVHFSLGIDGHWSKSHLFFKGNIDRWRSFLHKKAGIGYVQLRGSKGSVCRSSPEWVVDSQLPEACCNTYVLVMLLAHWCWSSATSLAGGALALLRNFLGQVFKDCWGKPP